MTLRVLVVDDEPLARRGIARRLAVHNDTELAGEAGDGDTALAAIREQAPDLMFLDVQMPGMSGLDALDLLPQGQRPLVVFVTAHEQFALHAFRLRALDYLLKPIDDERFAEALDRAREAVALRRGQGAPPSPCIPRVSPFAPATACRWSTPTTSTGSRPWMITRGCTSVASCTCCANP